DCDVYQCSPGDLSNSTNRRSTSSRLICFGFLSKPMTETERQHRWMVILAFALVYVFWGSTYLGIRIAVEHIPPALMCGVRFAIEWVLMMVYCGLRCRTIRYSSLPL